MVFKWYDLHDRKKTLVAKWSDCVMTDVNAGVNTPFYRMFIGCNFTHPF